MAKRVMKFTFETVFDRGTVKACVLQMQEVTVSKHIFVKTLNATTMRADSLSAIDRWHPHP
jgi:methionine synthase I (cobalamin-dependent)